MKPVWGKLRMTLGEDALKLVSMKKTLLALSLMSLSPTVFAFAVSDKCDDLQKCAKAFSEVLGENYLYDGEFRGKVESSPKFEVTKENAEEVFTHILHLAGFTRVPLAQPKTFSIMRQRDARDTAIPVLDGSQKEMPKIPNNWDITTLKYKLTNGEVAEQIARTLRSFMPANARIIPNELSGMVLITDNNPNLKKCIDLIRSLDVKPTAEMRKNWAKREQEYNQLQLQRAKNGKSKED